MPAQGLFRKKMIHSTIYNKNTNEDPKTSTIFEHLVLLPDNVFYSVIHKSIRTFKNEIPKEAGTLESFEFWPKWNPENTINSNYVEPDVFIRFKNFDLIIEAKYNDISGQYKEEWEREVVAYKNEYSNERKDVYLLAVGGNSNFNLETIKSCKILKCNWTDILKYVIETRDSYENNVCNKENSSLIRIFDLIIKGFHIMGVNEQKNKTELAALNNIYSLLLMFDEACNRRETEKFIVSKYSDAPSSWYYIYRFHVEVKNEPQKDIYLGLGMWYQYGTIAIEVDPRDGWAKQLAEQIESEKKFSTKYLASQYKEDGKYYFETNDKFSEDFSKAESYDAQLMVLENFVDELIEDYICNS